MQQEKQEKIIYSIKEISELLGISEATIRKLVKNEDFPSVKIGGRIFAEKDQFLEWIKNQNKKGANDND